VKQSCAYLGQPLAGRALPDWRLGDPSQHKSLNVLRFMPLFRSTALTTPARSRPCTRDQHEIPRTFFSRGNATVARAGYAGKHLKHMVLMTLDPSKPRAHHPSSVKRELRCPLSEARVLVSPNQSSCQNRHLRQGACHGDGTSFAFHSALHGDTFTLPAEQSARQTVDDLRRT
jgi:hypothetical protein